MTRIERPTTPNTFLAAPAGTRPEPDLVTAEQARPPPELFDAVRLVFGGQQRTYVAAEYPDRRQIHYVVRSAVLNFPDLVTVQVDAGGADRSTLTVWSRSVYGRNDFGLNRQRTDAWLAALQQQTNER